MQAIGKFQAGGSLVQIPAEQFAKQATSHDESIPIVHKMKSIRASFLFQ